MSYLKDREIWLSSVPTGNPPAGYVWVFIQNGVFVVRDSNGVDKIMATTTGTVTNATSASYVEYSNVANKPALISGSSQVSYTGLSNVPAGIVSSSAQVGGYGVFATTGSNTFQANQTITGSLFITQNLVVAGSSSIQYISSSVLDIADNIITVNAFNPAIRFGGLAVIDSGSSPQVSGSLLFDSIKDQWIFVHQNQSVVTSSVVLMGPETYNDLGNESYISANRLPKGSGVEHLRDSNITDTGTVVSINSNTQVTGSFTVVSGSAVELQVTNLGVNIGSALTDSHIISGSLRVNPNGLFVSGSGNVGIGTTSPTSRLMLYQSSAGNVLLNIVSNQGSSTQAGINFSPSMTDGELASNPAQASIYATDSNYGANIIFSTKTTGAVGNALTERMRITSGGNVFINNSSGVTLNDLTNRLSVSSTTYNLFDISRFSDNAFGPNFYLVKSRNGSIGGNTIVANGDNLGNISWLGANGTGFTDAASIKAEVDGTPGASDMPGRLVFSTTADGTTNNTERMRITSGGFVGIGTNNPSYILHAKAASGSTTGLRLESSGGTTNFDILASEGDGNAYLYQRSNYSILIGTNNSLRMTITAGGFVGIGTTPLYLLHIPQDNNLFLSNLYLTGTANNPRLSSGATGGSMSLEGGGAAEGKIYLQGAGSGGDGYIQFFAGGAERMRLTSTGFFKAKGTESTYLDITSTGNYHELRTGTGNQWSTIMSNTSASPYILNLRHSNSTPNNSDNWFIYCEDLSTVRFRIASNGNVTNANGSYGSISDIKLKENITDATPKLDDLLKVKVRNYNLIGEETKQIGVIAQELEEVFPAMIDESEDFEEVEITDEEGNTTKEKQSLGTTTKSVKYSVFVPMLIKAIQELKSENDNLKSRLEVLEQS